MQRLASIQKWVRLLSMLHVLALSVQGCATPYQAANGVGLPAGGYGQQQLEPDIWRISFTGVGVTTRETVQTYWLYHASEVALQQGYDGFEILSSMQFVGLPTPPRQIAAGAHVIFIPTYYGGGNPGIALTGDIRLLKAPIVPRPPKVFDALQLKAALEGPVNGAKCDQQNVCPHVHRYLLAQDSTTQPGQAVSPPILAPAAVPVRPIRQSSQGGAISADTSSASPTAAPRDAKTATSAAPTQPQAPMPPSSFRCPDAGTVIHLSTGSVLTFEAGSDFRCPYVDENRARRERYAIFVDGYGDVARPELNSLWPLQTGSHASFFVSESSNQPTMRTVTGRAAQESFAVMRQERITVPAGTFDTFVVEWREADNSGTAHKVKVTSWYAPAVGYIVKSKIDVEDPGAVTPFALTTFANLTYEATAITAANGSAITGVTPAQAAPVQPATRALSSGGKPAASSAVVSVEQRLDTLRQLLDEKLITRQEYAARRKAIIDGL